MIKVLNALARALDLPMEFWRMWMVNNWTGEKNLGFMEMRS